MFIDPQKLISLIKSTSTKTCKKHFFEFSGDCLELIIISFMNVNEFMNQKYFDNPSLFSTYNLNYKLVLNFYNEIFL